MNYAIGSSTALGLLIICIRHEHRVLISKVNSVSQSKHFVSASESKLKYILLNGPPKSSGGEVCRIGGSLSAKRDGRSTISGSIWKLTPKTHKFNFSKNRDIQNQNSELRKNDTKLFASNKHTKLQNNIFIFSCAVVKKKNTSKGDGVTFWTVFRHF